MKSSVSKFIGPFVFSTWAVISTASVQAQAVEPAATHKPRATLNQVHLQQLTSDPTKFRLHFNNPAPGKVLLTITDTEGNTLLNKKIEEASFAQTFDLSKLKDGVYTFTLLKGKAMVKKMVQLNTDYVMVKKASIR